jgi:hypothetical protein
MADKEKWITVKDAAEQSGYAISTLQWLLRAGKVEGMKFGRDWLTTIEAVEKFKNTAKPGRPRKSPQQDG